MIKLDLSTSKISKEDMREANLKLRRAEVLIAAEQLADKFYNAVRNYKEFKGYLVVEVTQISGNMYEVSCEVREGLQ